MLSLLRTGRWLGFTALVIGAIIAFGLLSRWQWSRADVHREERIALAAALAATPVPVSRSGGLPAEWARVTAEGVYEPADQVGVRKRPLEGQNGFWVMTPLDLDSGGTVWVNRGWVPVTGDALSTPDFPAPPAGTVTITGLARSFEEADADLNDGLPTGQVVAPALAALPGITQPVDYYVQLATSDPEQQDITVLPLPEAEMDEGRNISYAVQWLLFAMVAMGGWFFFLRREAREDAEREQAAA